METYSKPIITSYSSVTGMIPAAIVGLSAAKLMVAGVAAGLAISSSRNIHFDTTISKTIQENCIE